MLFWTTLSLYQISISQHQISLSTHQISLSKWGIVVLKELWHKAGMALHTNMCAEVMCCVINSGYSLKHGDIILSPCLKATLECVLRLRG